mmetsp:Transcript_6648/g.16510  ORF Transcript_6648/g.16510 Transcript_6648/m.16510 type:complete len:202 (-) Transcript_6648:193-798(-)
MGMRKDAAYRSTPVSALMTAAPPRMSIEVTITLVARQKNRNTMCAALPHLHLMISSTVWMFGALRLTSTARIANSSTWMVAPAAYQRGPDTPYLNATFEDCSSVAAHVHFDTMSHATRPVLTDLPAVLKSSSSSCTPPYFRSTHMSTVEKTVKIAPSPTTMNQPRPSGRGTSEPKKEHCPSYLVMPNWLSVCLAAMRAKLQ